jgi:predicted transcriptional regulator
VTRGGKWRCFRAVKWRQARALLTRPDESVSSVTRPLGVSRSTVYKYLPELGGQLSSAE